MSRRYVGGSLIGQFENLFVPNPIAAAALPEELRDAVPARIGGHGHKWYACVPEEGGFLVAVDFQTGSEPAERRLYLGRWVPGASGPLQAAVEIAIPVQFERPFGCKTADELAGAAPDGATLPVVGGYIWDRRAALIRGETRDGREFETVPRNGCYLLVPPPGQPGQWREVHVADRRKRLLYGRDLV